MTVPERDGATRAPAARSSATVVHDLHELLQRAPVAGPYVLVGHSIGGEYVRAFTAKFPSEVAGVVLVDSTHPDQHEPPIMVSADVNRIPQFVSPASVFWATSLRSDLDSCGLQCAIPLSISRRNSVLNKPRQARAMRNQRVKASETEADSRMCCN